MIKKINHSTALVNRIGRIGFRVLVCVVCIVLVDLLLCKMLNVVSSFKRIKSGVKINAKLSRDAAVIGDFMLFAMFRMLSWPVSSMLLL